MDDGDTSSLKRSLSIKFSEVFLKYGKALGKILHESGCVDCQNEVCLQRKYLCKEIETLRSERERETLFFLAVLNGLYFWYQPQSDCSWVLESERDAESHHSNSSVLLTTVQS